MPWTPDQILALAPDASSAKAGKDLSAPRKWTLLGANDVLVWGLCQGSGKSPYQTSIDLGEPAFKCSCPSRKFPCKHGLGLFLALAQSASAFTSNDPPAWAVEWLEKRAATAEKKAAKADAPPEEKSPEELAKAAAAAEKRAVKREGNVAAGLEEMHLWLRDIMRGGLASLPGREWSFFEAPAARLVDNQAAGLARRVRRLAGIPSSGEGWPQRFLSEAARLHLVREGWSRLQTLPLPVQADLRSVIGFTENKEEILAGGEVLADRWLVMGSIIEEEDRMRIQRTWLQGQATARRALCLAFSSGPNMPLDASLLPGTAFTGEVVFYPGNWPQRALVKSRLADAANVDSLPGARSVGQAYEEAADAFIANPWLEQVPLSMAQVVPVWRQGALHLRDEEGDLMPLLLDVNQAWRLFSLGGGRPLSVFGEWLGGTLRPLSCFVEGRFLRI